MTCRVNASSPPAFFQTPRLSLSARLSSHFPAKDTIRERSVTVPASGKPNHPRLTLSGQQEKYLHVLLLSPIGVHRAVRASPLPHHSLTHTPLQACLFSSSPSPPSEILLDYCTTTTTTAENPKYHHEDFSLRCCWLGYRGFPNHVGAGFRHHGTGKEFSPEAVDLTQPFVGA